MGIHSLTLEQILRSRKRLRREYLVKTSLQSIRVAVLGGTTTNEVVDLLELLLLSEGIAPVFYQSEYNKFYEDATLDSMKIVEFKPDLVYVHTHYLNISRFPSANSTDLELGRRISDELSRFAEIWNSLHEVVGCQIIQNNFEHPPFPPLGNLDSTAVAGHTRLVYELNLAFARFSNEHRWMLVHDINALASRIGLLQWFDWDRWYNYKILTSLEGSYEIAKSLAALIGAMLGKVKKCLILDLDNTLWGGVIGDDGLDRIQIGKETALAEAYTAFQQYCLALRNRGILLAVCSKNDEVIARLGFTHPDSVLKIEHFSVFKANWEPKPDNIRQIATDLNLGIESFVFIDDNPAERSIVSAQLPSVAVPDVGSDVCQFATVIQAGHFFEMVSLSPEDLVRADTYSANMARVATQSKFKDYGEYLDSLEMTAEIDVFKPVYLDRITQLINKTNQFNLTTRRYTFAEIENIAENSGHVALYGKLTDVFGDNGLVSVVIGRVEASTIYLDLWIMSCRVLKRDMELAMLDTLVDKALAIDAKNITGHYLQSDKNGMVANHYRGLGFELIPSDESENDTIWTLDLSIYNRRNTHIRVK